MPEILTGTSGFSYKEWKGSFYPQKLANDKMLAYYAERLPTVEINNTFYRLPSASLLERWAEETPDSFSFVLKASRKITHRKDIDEACEALLYLLKTTQQPGREDGTTPVPVSAVLSRRACQRLGRLLELVPEERMAACEFRNESWFDNEVYALPAPSSGAATGGRRQSRKPKHRSSAQPTGAIYGCGARATATRTSTPWVGEGPRSRSGRGPTPSSNTRTKGRGRRWRSSSRHSSQSSGLAARLLVDLPEPAGAQRDLEDLDAGAGQSVFDGLGEQRADGDGSGLAGALDAERVER